MLSMVTNKVLDFIYDTHSHKITDWNHALLAPALLQTYADVIYCIYRRDSETYSKARRISKGGVQREQNAPCFKISIPSTSKWDDWKHVWTSWLVCTDVDFLCLIN